MRHRRRTFCAIRTFSRKRQRNGPLEDCGGISGFYELLEPIAERAHPGHVHAKEWAGDYDPDTFDDLPIKYSNTGQYFYKCLPTTPSRPARDDRSALLLWQRSAVLAGMKDGA